MRIKNTNKKHVVIYNGSTYERLAAGGISRDLSESTAAYALAKFSGLEIYKARTKKAPKKGADKAMKKVED